MINFFIGFGSGIVFVFIACFLMIIRNTEFTSLRVNKFFIDLKGKQLRERVKAKNK